MQKVIYETCLGTKENQNMLTGHKLKKDREIGQMFSQNQLVLEWLILLITGVSLQFEK